MQGNRLLQVIIVAVLGLGFYVAMITAAPLNGSGGRNASKSIRSNDGIKNPFSGPPVFDENIFGQSVNIVLCSRKISTDGHMDVFLPIYSGFGG
jgi:hypothetical protein